MNTSWVSRAFDWGTALSGTLLMVWALFRLGLDPGDVSWVYFIAVPVITIIGWFPMLIGRTGGGIEVGLDACVLIFLVNRTSPTQALTIWALGTLFCQVLNDKRVPTKAFNFGLGVLAGGLAILVIELTRVGARDNLRELLAMGLGAAVYFLFDFVVTAISLSLEERTSLARELAPTGALGALIAFVAVSSLGYLAALVVGKLDGYASALLVVPVATILVASRAQSRGAEHARRLKILLDTAVDVQTASDRQTLLETLRVGAADLLRDHRVRLRDSGPGRHEIGVRVRGTADELWIVGPALNRARSTANDDQQGLAALVAVAEDGFQRLVLSEAMAHQAWHDPLTGLANRSLFMDRVEHAMDLQRRRGGTLAVLFCDLDGFKRVNDLFGHAAGDELLVEVGQRIIDSVRKADTVARLGGDEFAVLLEDVADLDEVTRACQRILVALRARFQVRGEDVSVTTTIGVAMSETGQSADALLSQADLAMYHAKGQGKNRYETYRMSFGDERLQRIELVETLRRAIDERELHLAYQPVIDLRSKRIIGVEALVRWTHDGAAVPPELFIPTAEDGGLIVGLGDVVLDQVTADTPLIREAAGRRLSIGINVSAQQLQIDAFVPRVLAAKAAMGGVDLVLEVTERNFVHNDPRTLAVMSALAEADVRFAIDDFGVGFSSMEYLQRLPVRILKVDKSFLANIEDDPRACPLVRSMVVLGDALGLEVVIEGIERLTQLEHVTEHAGAILGQGFLFATPMPRDALIDLLADRRKLVALPESLLGPETAGVSSL
jgi:diguanylate cyclase (GGDEF)-like protein